MAVPGEKLEVKKFVHKINLKQEWEKDSLVSKNDKFLKQER